MTADLLDHLLSAPPTPEPAADLSAWIKVLNGADYHSRRLDAPLHIAVRGGFAADRLGLAFAAGYQAACRRLHWHAGAQWILALCATEEGGNHPRAIKTRLEDGRLSGEKLFVTFGPLAEGLIVLASEGQHESGHNRLKAVIVKADAPGVTVLPQPPLPFVPEIPHAVVRLEGAVPTTVIPGDGYLRVLKPFRTIEDIHVHTALVAHLIQVGRRCGWAAEHTEALLALLSGLATIAPLEPSSKAVHRTLGGLIAGLKALLPALDFSAVEPDVQQRWERDSPLLQIALRARQARLRAARPR